MSSELYLWKKGNTWAKVEADGSVKVGVIPDALKRYPRITSVRFTVQEGQSVKQGDKIVSIGAGKMTVALEAPVSGVVARLNTKVKTNPAIIKHDPLGEGWLMVIKPTNLEEDLKKLVRG